MIHSYADYAKERAFRSKVVVVGTGAGGAVVGAELAAEGHEVTFVEEGGWHPTSSFNPYLSESVPRLYRDGAATVIYGNPPIPFVEGRCVGGSTTINGGMTYRPQNEVFEHWEEMTGSPDLGPAGLEPHLARVEDRISAKKQAPWSLGGDNRIMDEGAHRKGWHYSHNARAQDHCVGSNNCILGCTTGAKQSTLVSYMPRAMQAGARCLTEVRVDRLLIEGGRCVGVAGAATNPRTQRQDRPVEIRADHVVIACGAVQSPYLLLRHKLARRSKQLGRNFFIHPNTKMLGLFGYEVAAWRGVSQGGQVRHFHDEGIVLAENFVPPGAMGTIVPSIDSQAWRFMQRYHHMVLGGCLVEDSRPGRIRRSPFGVPLPTYEITDYDFERFCKAVRLLSEMWFGVGVERILLPFHHLQSIASPDEIRLITPERLRKQDTEYFTPHLMGTCRMGGRAEESVVDLEGRLWDLPGCYVADASVFPTAVGVNPQVTIMALATLIASRLANRLS